MTERERSLVEWAFLFGARCIVETLERLCSHGEVVSAAAARQVYDILREDPETSPKLIRCADLRAEGDEIERKIKEACRADQG